MGKAVSLHPLAVFTAVATGSILYGIAGALFAVPVMAVINTVVRYLADGRWRTDDEVAWEPYYYPWEIKKHARRNGVTRQQVMAQLERFRRGRAKERQRAKTKHEQHQAHQKEKQLGGAG